MIHNLQVEFKSNNEINSCCIHCDNGYTVEFTHTSLSQFILAKSSNLIRQIESTSKKAVNLIKQEEINGDTLPHLYIGFTQKDNTEIGFKILKSELWEKELNTLINNVHDFLEGKINPQKVTLVYSGNPLTYYQYLQNCKVDLTEEIQSKHERIQSLNEHLQELSTDYQVSQDKYSLISEELSRTQSDLNQARQLRQETELDYNNLTKEIQIKQQAKQKLDGQVELADELLLKLTRSITDKTQKLNQLTSEEERLTQLKTEALRKHKLVQEKELELQKNREDYLNRKKELVANEETVKLREAEVEQRELNVTKRELTVSESEKKISQDFIRLEDLSTQNFIRSSELSNMKDDLDKRSDTVRKQEIYLEDLRVRLSQQETQLNRKETEFSERFNHLFQRESNLEAKESQLKKLESTLALQTTKVKTLERDVYERECNLTEQEHFIDEELKRLEKETDQHNTLSAQLKIDKTTFDTYKIREERRLNSEKQELEQEFEKLMAIQMEIEELKETFTITEEDINNLKIEKEALSESINKAHIDLEDSNNELRTLNLKVSDCKTSLQQLEEEKTTLQFEIQGLQEQYTTQTESYQKQLEDAQAQLQSIERSIEETISSESNIIEEQLTKLKSEKESELELIQIEHEEKLKSIEEQIIQANCELEVITERTERVKNSGTVKLRKNFTLDKIKPKDVKALRLRYEERLKLEKEDDLLFTKETGTIKHDVSTVFTSTLLCSLPILAGLVNPTLTVLGFVSIFISRGIQTYTLCVQEYKEAYTSILIETYGNITLKEYNDYLKAHLDTITVGKMRKYLRKHSKGYKFASLLTFAIPILFMVFTYLANHR